MNLYVMMARTVCVNYPSKIIFEIMTSAAYANHVYKKYTAEDNNNLWLYEDLKILRKRILMESI